MNRRNFLKSIAGISLALPTAGLLAKSKTDTFSMEIVTDRPEEALNLISPILNKNFTGPISVRSYQLVGRHIADIAFFHNGRLMNIHTSGDSISRQLLSTAGKLNLLKRADNPQLIKITNIQATSAKNLNIVIAGKLVERIPVNENINDMAITSDYGEFYLNMQNGKAGVKGSSCKHKTCEKTGNIHKPGDSIVCIPSRINIHFDGNRSGIDALSY